MQLKFHEEYDMNVLGQLKEKEKTQLRVKRLIEDAIVPTRDTEFSSGLNLHALTDYSVDFQSMTIVHTGIAVEIPEGYFGLLVVNEDLGTKHHIRLSTGASIISSDFHDEICIPLQSDVVVTDTEDVISNFYYIKKGSKVAQLLIVPCMLLDPIEVSTVSGTSN